MKRVWSLCLLLALLTISSQASATELIGPKAFGMGGAFTAVADDASSFYWNPAGLTRSGFVGGEASVGLSTSSLGDIFRVGKAIGSGNPVDAIKAIQQENNFNGRVTGFVGANVKNFSGGIIVNENLQFSLNDGKGSRHSEKIGNIGMGVDLNDPLWNIGKISVGANLKLIQRDEYTYTYNVDENKFIQDSFEPSAVTELGLDLGSLVRVTDMVNVALVARNMRTQVQKDGKASIQIQSPESVTLGTALKLPYPLALTVAADLEHKFATKDSLDNDVPSVNVLHIGAEKGLMFNMISVRAGVYGPFQTSERAFTETWTGTAGVGVNMLGIRANAAAGISSDFKNFHSTISAAIKF